MGANEIRLRRLELAPVQPPVADVIPARRAKGATSGKQEMGRERGPRARMDATTSSVSRPSDSESRDHVGASETRLRRLELAPVQPPAADVIPPRRATGATSGKQEVGRELGPRGRMDATTSSVSRPSDSESRDRVGANEIRLRRLELAPVQPPVADVIPARRATGATSGKQDGAMTGTASTIGARQLSLPG